MSATLPVSLQTFYPYTGHYLTLPSGRLHYLDEGEGEAVVMVHGNPTWSFYYRGLVKALSGRFRCIVPDHIGCGLSDKPQDFSYRLADHIDNLECLLDSLKIERYNLIVHDWGGAIGLGCAGRKPERVGRIVVLNTAAFFLDRLPRRIAICRSPRLGEWLVRRWNAFAGPATRMAVVRPLSPAVRAGYLWPYQSPHDRIAIARFVQDIPMESDHPSRDTLAAVEANLKGLTDKPMAIHWGGKDFCFNDHFLAEWRRRFPAAAIQYYANAGHYVLEDAGDLIAPAVASFLAGQRNIG